MKKVEIICESCSTKLAEIKKADFSAENLAEYGSGCFTCDCGHKGMPSDPVVIE